MSILNNFSIGNRLNLILGTIVALFIVLLGAFITRMQEKQILASNDSFMLQQVQDLNELISRQAIDKQYNLSSAFRIAAGELSENFVISINEDGNVEKTVKDPVSGGRIHITMPIMLINGYPLINDTSFVAKIRFLTYSETRLCQKVNGGYVCLSSSFVDKSGNYVNDFYIPNTSDIVTKIEQGTWANGREMVDGEWYISAYNPIYIGDKIVGMLSSSVKEKDLAFLSEAFGLRRYLDNGYPSLLGSDGTYVLHPKQKNENIAGTELYKNLKKAKNGQGKIVLKENGEKVIRYFRYSQYIDAYTIVTVFTSDLMAVIKKIRQTLGVALVIIIGVFILVNNYISRSITKPLEKAVSFAENIASGNLQSELDINQEDEVGKLANALKMMTTNLRGIVMEISDSSFGIFSASQQVNSSSVQLSQSANDQASSIEEVSSTMEEMVSNIQQNRQNTQIAEEIAEKAYRGMLEVNRLANRALEATANISEKVSIINDIAFQTNILALNAAVEASGAGKYGKGFAVIAEEVRKLADISKQAGNQIVELSQVSMKLADDTMLEMSNMMADVEKTSKLVKDISASNKEQFLGAEQINATLQGLNSISQRTAATSEELEASSEALYGQADRLKKLTSYFETDSEG